MADQTQPPRRQREFPTAGMIEPDRYAIHRVRFTAVTFTSFISMKLGNTEIRLLATNSGGRLKRSYASACSTPQIQPKSMALNSFVLSSRSQ